MVLEEVYEGWSRAAELPQTPGVVQTVWLPEGTQGVRLWTAEATIWFTIGDTQIALPPGPIQAPATGNPIQDNAFIPGHVLLPNVPTTVATFDTGLQPKLQLVSESAFATITITALVTRS